jgi:hypothetical protein
MLMGEGVYRDQITEMRARCFVAPLPADGERDARHLHVASALLVRILTEWR